MKNKRDMIKWLNNLKSDIGQPQHSQLWQYAEIIDVIAKYLESTERSKGEWIKSYFNECCGTDENHNPVFRKTPCVKCDQCGEKRRNEEKFCPNCGANMKGANYETD